MLGLLITWELRSGPGVSDPGSRPLPAEPANPDPQATAAIGTIMAFPPLQHYDEVTARPLFSDTRRPESADEKPEEPAAAVDEGIDYLTLIGVVISSDKNLAIIQDKRLNKIVRVEQGNAIQDWELADVAGDRVTLKRDGREASLPLRRERDQSATPAAGVPRPPAGRQAGRPGVFRPR
jgi:general secretion pathway protein N